VTEPPDASGPDRPGPRDPDGYGRDPEVPPPVQAGSSMATHGADVDDLEAYRRRRRRRTILVMRVVALLALAGLLLPTGRWAIEELRFRLQQADVVATLEGEVAGAELAETVLLVRAVGCRAGAISSGSAFVVATSQGPRLVTNRHVVEDTARVGVSTLDADRTWPVEAVEVSDAADVAVLHLGDDVELPPPLALSRSRPATGDEVRLVGFPAARPFTTEGEVASVSSTQVLLDLEVDRGASGSPVVDHDGEVVAQVFAVTRDGLGVATPSEHLLGALDAVRPLPDC
jgi:hypothetical protein